MICFCFHQLQPNSASGSGALEHDPSSIYLRVPVGEAVPGPLPLGVSVIDASVALFGVVFPHVSFKHRSVNRDSLHSLLLSEARNKPLMAKNKYNMKVFTALHSKLLLKVDFYESRIQKDCCCYDRY